MGNNLVLLPSGSIGSISSGTLRISKDFTFYLLDESGHAIYLLLPLLELLFKAHYLVRRFRSEELDG